MRPSTLPIIVLALAPWLCLSTGSAAEPATGEAKLRESLRATMLQLRTAETERANLQALQAENERKNKTLTEQVEALTKRMTQDKEASDKTLAELKTRASEQEAELAKFKDALIKWQAAQKQAAELATKTEAQRAKLAGEVIVLQRKVSEQQMKNAAMYRLANEILTRYEKFGLGEALTAREPFVGITRVKLQNYVQDYGDKLSEQTIKP